MMTKLNSLLAAVTIALGMTVAAGSFAETYPSRTVKIVVPYAAGGGTDILTRLIANHMSKTLGQTVIVDNRPGGSTIVGAEIVAKSKPDGYTLLASAASTFSINPSLYANLPYDPIKEFSPISLTGSFPLLLVVSKDFPAKSVKELLDMAKAKPGTINYASAGIGSTHHLATELFKQRTGIDIVHVPYRGAGPAAQGLIGGQVPMMFLDLAVATGPLKGGKIRALGVATMKRIAEFPDVPTINEAGVPGYEAFAWNGIVAPAGTPADVINTLNSAMGKALAADEVKDKMKALGIEPVHNSPAEFAAFIKSEATKWGEVVRRGRIEIGKSN